MATSAAVRIRPAGSSGQRSGPTLNIRGQVGVKRVRKRTGAQSTSRSPGPGTPATSLTCSHQSKCTKCTRVNGVSSEEGRPVHWDLCTTAAPRHPSHSLHEPKLRYRALPCAALQFGTFRGLSAVFEPSSDPASDQKQVFDEAVMPQGASQLRSGVTRQRLTPSRQHCNQPPSPPSRSVQLPARRERGRPGLWRGGHRQDLDARGRPSHKPGT
jgi:hypothetical protein